MRPRLRLARLLRRSVSDDRPAALPTRARGERGTALLETALTLPLLLLVAVGIFEFGRAYQTWQVLTNAAREGARIAVLPNYVAGSAEARVTAYMQAGQLSNAATATVIVNPAATISIGTGTATASLVTVNYPFQFMVLQPIASLISGGPKLGAPFTMVASAEMRNEAQ
jgi:Flp pilus assembly protein TadG